MAACATGATWFFTRVFNLALTQNLLRLEPEFKSFA
jgi:hypothetical protein